MVGSRGERGSVLTKSSSCVFRVFGSSLIAARCGSASPKNSNNMDDNCSETGRAANRSRTRRRETSGSFLDANAKVIAHQLQYRLKRRCPAMSQDTCFIDADALCATTFGKFETKAALADASLADDTHNTTVTLAWYFRVLVQERRIGRFGR